MEKNLEHKIAEAYQNKDASTKYQGKEVLWNRLRKAQNPTLRVNRYWKIAAIIVAAFFVSSAFAGFHYLSKHQREVVQLRKNKLDLSASIDSLQNTPIEVLIKTEIVEKEVKVYVPEKTKKTQERVTDEHFEALLAENIELKLQLKKIKEHLKNKLDSMENELIATRRIAEEKESMETAENDRIPIVVLKPEMPKDQFQKPVQTTNQGLKIQFFNKQSESVKFDMNSSILKK